MAHLTLCHVSPFISSPHHSIFTYITIIIVSFILINPSPTTCTSPSPSRTHPITLYAPFNAIGIKGNITFYQELPDAPVIISVHLTSSQPGSYSWGIHTNPVLYGIKSSCNKVELGQIERKLSDKHGLILIPAPSDEPQIFSDNDLMLKGLDTIWGRSLLLTNMNTSMKVEVSACSNIFHGGQVKTSEAVFANNFAGKVIFRENELGETMIYNNLFYTSSEYKPASQHEWRILVTDVLDSDRFDKCNYLSQLFDPDNKDDRGCSPMHHQACKMGDLTKKHTTITVGSANNRYSKQFFIDSNLPISPFLEPGASRKLYLVVYEKLGRVFNCAQITPIQEREVKAEMDMDGVKGFFRFSQRYIMDPAVVTVSLKGLMGRGRYYHIHEFPVPAMTAMEDRVCSDFSVGGHFNPLNVQRSPPPGVGTNDQYEMGDLSGKYGLLPEGLTEHHLAVFVDMNLSLFGTNSVIGRSVVIHETDGSRWICAPINYPDEMITAEANFYYPVYGKIIFRQLKDNPFSETSVFIDVAYSDTNVNDTDGHTWSVYTNPAGRDFYNWTRRCNSAGDEYNPFEVGADMSKNAKCSSDNPFRCSAGDLTSKSKRVDISAFKGSRQNKMFYTDVLLPLSGPHSIIGRSVVIKDEHAPAVRGNRMACTNIFRLHPISAAVRRWRVGAGITSNITGAIQFHQEGSLDRTHARVYLHGLNGQAGGYHVHETWVPIDKEFPCSNDVVYGHFNPLNMDASVGPLPGASTSDQYEMGDLSGKFGLLDHKAIHKKEVSDPNLSLHGTNSIIGRSIVIHKIERNARWVCGTIQPEVPKDEGREVVAIASFDDPKSLIQGFIRMKQFEYKDGSMSTTWMEVDLRYPGKHDRNITTGHEWSIFVNQVGADAFNPTLSVKCIAAGFRWNPYLSYRENRHYHKDCNRHNPMRCEMGDLTGKHGPLTVGGKRFVVADVNLPLVGNYSVLHRSIVIFDKNHNQNFKLACSNIKPDQHLVTNIAVKRHPTFTVNKFMDQMRDALGTTPWLVQTDLDQLKPILGDECLQLTIHFYGEYLFKGSGKRRRDCSSGWKE